MGPLGVKGGKPPLVLQQYHTVVIRAKIAQQKIFASVLHVAAYAARVLLTNQKVPSAVLKKTFLKNGILFVLRKIKKRIS